MILRKTELRTFERSPGVDITILVEPERMYEAGRMYALITIAPGAGLSRHRHDAEMESFYVVKGTCRVDDNGETAELSAGDVLITQDGECHEVHNDSDEPVELIALIVSGERGVAGKSVAV